MKALLIDHDDSFTHNLRHWLQPVCREVQILNHRELISAKPEETDLIVLSPGPKSPQDYPHVLKFIQNSGPTAIYGVCLGLQMLVYLSGGAVHPYTPPLHGKKSKLQILNSQHLNLKNLEVARYHSLICSGYDTDLFETVALSKEDNLPMWLQHRQKKWMGVQFHPESFLTEKPELHQAVLKKWMSE